MHLGEGRRVVPVAEWRKSFMNEINANRKNNQLVLNTATHVFFLLWSYRPLVKRLPFAFLVVYSSPNMQRTHCFFTSRGLPIGHMEGPIIVADLKGSLVPGGEDSCCSSSTAVACGFFNPGNWGTLVNTRRSLSKGQLNRLVTIPKGYLRFWSKAICFLPMEFFFSSRYLLNKTPYVQLWDL